MSSTRYNHLWSEPLPQSFSALTYKWLTPFYCNVLPDVLDMSLQFYKTTTLVTFRHTLDFRPEVFMEFKSGDCGGQFKLPIMSYRDVGMLKKVWGRLNGHIYFETVPYHQSICLVTGTTSGTKMTVPPIIEPAVSTSGKRSTTWIVWTGHRSHGIWTLQKTCGRT